MGEGWGFSCSQCPRPGTKAFDELCPKGYGFVDQVFSNFIKLTKDHLNKITVTHEKR